ncbi:hypothetical protein PMV_177 [Port-miou virus]|uniref:Ankyrin repeat-containing protein n=1 Tax=Port-miou virus TaxID=1733873 RepID=A0A0N9P6R3_9VIRU|nr:hypothetical protein PMV_177 [Port-miou virus]
MESFVFGVSELREHILSFLDANEAFMSSFVSSEFRETYLLRKDWKMRDENIIAFETVEHGTISAVRFLFEKLKYPPCDTLFDYAICSQNTKIHNYLWNMGCRPNHRHFDGLCSSGNIKNISWLWSRGIRPMRKGFWVWRAVTKGNLHVLRWFKKRGVYIPKQYVAELAVKYDQQRILDWCISVYNKLDKKALSKISLTFLSLEMVKRFWSHRPHKNKVSCLVLDNGDPRVIRFVWEQGVEFSQLDLECVISNGRIGSIVFLSQNIEHERDSLFRIAAYECNINAMECLLSLGYVPDESCFMAAVDGTVSCLDWLLKKNCPVPSDFVYQLKRNYNTAAIAWAKENGLE